MFSNRAIRLLFAATLLLSFSAGLRAQEAIDLHSGTRVRVTAATPTVTVRIGTLQAFDSSVLQLRSAGSSIEIPLAAITRLERSEGRKSNLLGGAVGLVVGAAAGGAVGCLANSDDYGVFCGGQSDAKVAAGAAVGAATGAVLGALLFRQERWSDVRLVR